MKCNYHEAYGGGRKRRRRATCVRDAVWTLRNELTCLGIIDTNVIVLCGLHARAIAGRFPILGGRERFARLSQ